MNPPTVQNEDLHNFAKSHRYRAITEDFLQLKEKIFHFIDEKILKGLFKKKLHMNNSRNVDYCIEQYYKCI